MFVTLGVSYQRLSEQLAISAAKIAALVEKWGTSQLRWGRTPRTGHRHYGTRDHKLRYTPARKDVPLGQRTMAKWKAVQ